MSENRPEIDDKELEQMAGGEEKKGAQDSDTKMAKKNADERKRAGGGSLRGFA